MKRVFYTIAISLLLAGPLAAGASSQKTFLIHVTRSMEKGDARTVVMPRAAAAALMQGFRVQILFDDDGTDAVTIGHWYGGHTTPLDKTAVRGEERKALSLLLGVPAGILPDNYGDLLRFLKGKGAELYVNEKVLELHGLGADRFDRAAVPVSVERMIELLGAADVIVSY